MVRKATEIAEAIEMQHTVISPPKFQVAELYLRGTAPLLQQRWSKKAREALKGSMTAGSTAAKGKKRDPRNFEEDFRQAQYVSEEGWNGVPAGAFRNACIDACRMVGYKMTHAKQALTVFADGLDAEEGTPLVKILGDKPERSEMMVRVGQGKPDIRVRPMWRKWGIKLRIRYDADQFTLTDVVNLIMRAGIQVGIQEGRPFSKTGNGLGFGTFEIVNSEEEMLK